MIKVRSLSAVLALGALAALPGCSMFGGGEQPPMAAAAPAPAPAPAMPAPEMGSSQMQASHSVVREVQSKLKAGRMYAGRIDGVWGPMTKRGVMRFQEKNNIQATGDLDDATLQAMNISAPAGGMNSGMSNGNMSDTGANGTNMPSGNAAGGAMNDNGSMNNGAMSAPPPMSGPSTGGTAAPAR
ncbi:MAG: peptidoglycan-binding domain-containing protein [Acetobacteraceae bacterium]